MTKVRMSGKLELIKSSKDKYAFPFFAMGGAAGQFAKIYSDRLESPIEFFYFSYLACLGNMLSPRLTLDIEVKPEPRMFVLNLGESADDRKSTAMKKTIAFFKDTFPHGGFNVCRGVGSAEGLAERFKHCKTDKNVILFLDEMKSFVSKSKIETSVLLPCVASLFEDNDFESWTKSGGVELEDVYLSMLAASTTQTFETMWNATFIDIGFLNRLFIVPATNAKRDSLPESVSEKDKALLRQATAGVLQKVGQSPRALSYDRAAFRLWDDWYMSIERSVHTKRIDTYGLRLLPLLAANEGKFTVDADIVTKVIAIMDWQLKMRKFYSPVDADNKIARMEASIRQKLSAGPLNNRDLQRACHKARYGHWIFDNALKNVMADREVVYDKKTKTYRLL
ncbi:hypothetical protein ES702_07440 [subsurface metagenome]